MNLMKFAIVPTILLFPAMAMACGPSGKELLFLGTLFSGVATIPLLVLPIGLLIKFRANIQSRLWSVFTLGAAWLSGAVSMSLLTFGSPVMRNFDTFQVVLAAGGLSLLVMTAVTMILYRFRANRVISAAKTAEF